MQPQNRTPALANSTYEPWAPAEAAPLLTATLLSLACLVGAAGNLYTLGLACGGRKRLPGRLAPHLASLALSDLLYLCTAPLLAYGSLAKDWALGEAGCRLLLPLDLAAMHATIFTLTLMSAERYLAVARPLACRRAGGGRARGGLAGAWGLALGLSLPMAAAVEVRVRELEGGSLRRLCLPGWREEDSRSYLTLLFVTSVLGPGLLILGLYAALARAYWRSQAGLTLGRSTASPPRTRTLLLALSVVLTYWLCYLPFWIWQLVPLYTDSLGLSFRTQGVINDLLSGLTYANSCLDPFLYTLLSRAYRERGRERRERVGTAEERRREERRGQASQGLGHHPPSREDPQTCVHVDLTSALPLAGAPFPARHSIPEM